MWAEAAVSGYSAVSQHILGWARGDREKPNPVAVIQDLETDKPVILRGNCQGMYKEQGISAAMSCLGLNSEKSSCPRVVPVYFHSWVGTTANCTKCLIS